MAYGRDAADLVAVGRLIFADSVVPGAKGADEAPELFLHLGLLLVIIVKNNLENILGTDLNAFAAPVTEIRVYGYEILAGGVRVAVISPDDFYSFPFVSISSV